jgi:hypothetical protein
MFPRRGKLRRSSPGCANTWIAGNTASESMDSTSISTPCFRRSQSAVFDALALIAWFQIVLMLLTAWLTPLAAAQEVNWSVTAIDSGVVHDPKPKRSGSPAAGDDQEKQPMAPASARANLQRMAVSGTASKWSSTPVQQNGVRPGPDNFAGDKANAARLSKWSSVSETDDKLRKATRSAATAATQASQWSVTPNMSMPNASAQNASKSSVAPAQTNVRQSAANSYDRQSAGNGSISGSRAGSPAMPGSVTAIQRSHLDEYPLLGNTAGKHGLGEAYAKFSDAPSNFGRQTIGPIPKLDSPWTKPLSAKHQTRHSRLATKSNALSSQRASFSSPGRTNKAGHDNQRWVSNRDAVTNKHANSSIFP